VLVHLVGLGVDDLVSSQPLGMRDLDGMRSAPPALPQNDALACQEGMGHDRTGVVATVDREAGLGSRLADAYVRSAPGGIRLAFLLTGDRTVAEDLVQEAFVRFVGRLRFLRDPDAFEPYLRRTIVNLSKNHFRRRAVERAFLEREGRRTEDVSTDPDVATYDSLRSALLRLPIRQRTALVLRYYEDLPDTTIAELLRCRQATVRSLVARGLAALRTTPEVIS
jgi:RNA polymerase sigma factor (sigma-70 family)